MSVRRASDYFRRRPPSFKSEGTVRQSKLSAKSRTEERSGARSGHLAGFHRLALLPVPAVPADVKVALISSRATSHRSGRSTRHRRSDGRDHTMHDRTTPAFGILEELRGQDLDSDLDRFGPIWNRDSKSKSPHGGGILFDLVYLDYSLERKGSQSCARTAHAPAGRIPPMRENPPNSPNGHQSPRSHAVSIWKTQAKPLKTASKILPNRGWSA